MGPLWFTPYPVAELALHLYRPFILLVPSNQFFDFTAQEHLAIPKARFFPLESIVRLTGYGTLLPAKSPGELFAQFRPEPDETDEATSRNLFALAKALDAQPGMRKAPPSTILRLYCVDALEPAQIASQLRCSLSLVYARLDLLRQKLGRRPSELRHYSAHFEAIANSLADPSAKRIRPQASSNVSRTRITSKIDPQNSFSKKSAPFRL